MTKAALFLLGCLAGFLASLAYQPRAEASLETQVLTILRSHGDLVLEAINDENQRRRLRQQVQTETLVRSHEGELLAVDADVPILGNRAGGKTIVYFFDATCPYCRNLDATLRTLMASDPEIRLVMRQVAVLGPRLPDGQIRPDAPARLAGLAAAALWQKAPEKYPAFMATLMGGAEAKSLARDYGLDATKLEGFDSLLTRNSELFRLAGGQGTPYLLIKGQGPLTIAAGTQSATQIEQSFAALNPKH